MPREELDQDYPPRPGSVVVLKHKPSLTRLIEAGNLSKLRSHRQERRLIKRRTKPEPDNELDRYFDPLY